jgi:serine/threonine protein kinase
MRVAMQGKVYKGRNTSTGEIVALKFIDHEAVRASSKALLNLQREITAMERVAGHPHVICVKKVEYDVSKPRKRRAGTFRRQIMIVMEIAAGGEEPLARRAALLQA